MNNRRALMEEFFELGSELRRLAGEYRAAMVPIQERRKEIEAALVGGNECASCSSQQSRTVN